MIQRSPALFLVFAVILGFSFPPCRSLRFDLQSGHTKCISEDIKSNSMTVGKYHVVNPHDGAPLPDTHKITVRVTSAQGNSYHYAERMESGQFAFTSVESGDYMACFWSDDHKPPATLTVDFEWRTGVAAKDWGNVAKKGSIDVVDWSLADIGDHWCMDGKVRVGKIYDGIRERGDRVAWYRVVWHARCTPKHSFVLWLAMLGRLPTADRLDFVDMERICRLCEDDDESHSHLFFTCSMTLDVWRQVCDGVGLPRSLLSLGDAVRWLGAHAGGSSADHACQVVALSATVYTIWHSRNAKCFDGNHFEVASMVRLIQRCIFRVRHSLM